MTGQYRLAWHDSVVERTYSTPLIDKLGVRPGGRVAIVGSVDSDGWFRELLAERTDDVTDGEALADTDLVFLAADSVPELSSLPDLRRRLRPNGAIWVISKKGRAATLRYAELLEAAQASGLVDNKVASFSDTHTALRFVIPVALRPRTGERVPSAHAGHAPDTPRDPRGRPRLARTEDAAETRPGAGPRRARGAPRGRGGRSRQARDARILVGRRPR